MSLNMYLGEVQSQTQSMNAVCTATIQGMEQAIQSIDAFATDTVLQGQTYSSAKSFFVQTFRPLAQGIIYLCEELIRQNNAFPSQFQSQVASTDVIEHEILEQIREIDRMKTSMEAVNQAMPMPGMDAVVNLFIVMRQKLQEKLDHLYQFNQTSSNNYSTAIQLAASIAAGLAEVQSGKGFSALTGIFSVKELNMEWAVAIHKKTEDKVHEKEVAKKKAQAVVKKDVEYLKGSIEKKEGDRFGLKAEGAIMKSTNKITDKSKFTFKAGSGSAEFNLPYSLDTIKEDVLKKDMIGIKIEGAVAEESIKIDTSSKFGEDLTLTSKQGTASYVYGFEGYTFKSETLIALQTYEAEITKIKIPDYIPVLGDYDISVKGEIIIGGYGYRFRVGEESGFSATSPNGYGGGVSFKFEKEAR
ncbi:hypothetical protein AWW70_18690 [Bacillus mycoides]|uniref:LXG domain-containing protein n=1 Tax=Bacillus mycoides TaxID=1405 RepID=A0A120EEL8_BACMY|nr:T7SS effector LXG polymorphic toxin [Bacillus mycoides]KWU59306.1 hypothetical protein AWW70_18690 [Bacillus mycoides]